MSLSFSHTFHAVGLRLFGPIAGNLKSPTLNRVLRYWPALPTRYKAPAPWPEPSQECPPELATVPGIWRDRAAEEAATREEPLHFLSLVHPAAYRWVYRHIWAELLPMYPRLARSMARVRKVAAQVPAAVVTETDPAKLTALLRAEARRLGISTVGFAAYDPKYTYAEVPPVEQGSVIVCILEQDWAKTQQIPSATCERSAFRTYAELSKRIAALSEYIQGLGYRAQPHTFAGESVDIHYGVEAGLGQMGLNGQLLTPQAGSRCRLTLINTNMTLVHGQPVDYGINAICDSCQLCVRRCPPGAIPNKRYEYRGVMKAKIKTERCLPVLSQSSGCGICMKVCPVQRYGLDRVKAHYVETGTILGKGTDELEGYDWIDGRRYGPGEKPRMTPDLVTPEGFDWDPTRKRPVRESEQVGGHVG